MDATRQIISKREVLRSIDFDTRTITVTGSKPKKITGTRLNAVLGKSKYKTPFATACDMVRLYTVVEETKFTNAGHVIEPKIREHVRGMIQSLSAEIGAKGNLAIEEPIPAEACWYDHFKNTPVFGGLVDGYVLCDGERCAVLEIKTSHDRSQWLDDEGKMSKIPEDYLMQASLYCELSKLEMIVFAVGFLEEGDYDRPEAWEITDDNFRTMVVRKQDISEEMREAKKWYNDLMETCTLPPWTDEDLEIVEYLSTKQLRMVSLKHERLISEYIRSGLRDEYLPEIRSQLAGYMNCTDSKMVYEQEGFRFTLVRDGDSAELTVEPKP